MTEPIDHLRIALADALAASSAANRNVAASIDAAMQAVHAVNLKTPRVLRIVKADPTGSGDATTDFQSTLDGAGVIYLPAGRYLIDPGVYAKLRSGTTLVYHKDAVLLLKPNGLERYYGIHMQGARDIQIIGGRIVGDRMAHRYGHGTHEHGMGIGIDRCARIRISDMRIEQCTGDGISAGGEDLVFERIVSTGNRRQGMSLYTGNRYKVLGGEYSHTGDMGTNRGTAPGAGIDIEQDAGDVSDVLFDGVNFTGNRTAGLLVWTRAGMGATRRVVATRCTFDSNANGINTKGLGGPVDVSVVRSRFTRNHGAAVRAESGSTVAVGSSDAADANTIVGMGARPPSSKAGKHDLQQIGTGVINAGINHYA